MDLEQIRKAQIKAAEDAVIADLKAKGLLPENAVVTDLKVAGLPPEDPFEHLRWFCMNHMDMRDRMNAEPLFSIIEKERRHWRLVLETVAEGMALFDRTKYLSDIAKVALGKKS